MNKNSLLNRSNQVWSTEALSREDHDFMATHLPFKNLEYETTMHGDEYKDGISEEVFIDDLILKNRENHRLVMVTGSSGSGKSHIIKWFHNRYRSKVTDSNDVIVLISRYDNTLRGALRQILNSEMLDGLENNSEVKKLMEAGEHLEESDLKETILGLLIAEINNDKDISEYLNRRISLNMHSFLTDELIRKELLLIDGGAIERIAYKMSNDGDNRKYEKDAKFYPEELRITDELLESMNHGESRASRRALRLADTINKKYEKAEEITSYLNSKIDKVIQNIIKINERDLLVVFNEIRKSLKEQGKDLVLFIEDITSMIGINRELLEALIIDHRSNQELCRVISFVGITTAYYHNSIPENIVGRVTDKINLTDKALIQTKGDLSDLIGRYINAINISEDEIKDWYTSGRPYINIPISDMNSDKEYSLVDIGGQKEVSIYPFTEKYLYNIYQGLEKKTPREFIRLVINKLYHQYLLNGVEVILTENMYKEIDIPSWDEALYEGIILEKNKLYGEELSLFLRLWGDGNIFKKTIDGEEYYGGLKKDIFYDYGFNELNGFVENEKAKRENKEKAEKLPEATDKEEANDEKIIDEDNELTKNEKDYREREKDLDKWIDGENLIYHIQLRDEVVNFYKNYIYWEAENIPPYILDQRLSRSLIYIEGQADLGEGGLVLKRNMETYYFLLGILRWRYLGERSWYFNNYMDYLYRVNTYLERHKQKLIDCIIRPLEITEKYNFEELLLLNQYYYNVIMGNISSDKSIENLFFILTSEEEYDLSIFRNYSDTWRGYAEIVSSKKERYNFNENRIDTLRYFNLILGDANPETNKKYNLNSYKILNLITKLRENSWEIDLGNRESKTSEALIVSPYQLFKKEITNKLPKVIEAEESHRKQIINEIEEEGVSLTDQNEIDLLGQLAYRYFENSKKIRGMYSEEDYKLLLNIEKNSKEIYREYKDTKDLTNKIFLEKLTSISKKGIDHLYGFNKEISRLIDKLDIDNRIFDQQMKDLDPHLREEIKNKEIELESNLSYIDKQVKKIMEVL